MRCRTRHGLTWDSCSRCWRTVANMVLGATYSLGFARKTCSKNQSSCCWCLMPPQYEYSSWTYQKRIFPFITMLGTRLPNLKPFSFAGGSWCTRIWTDSEGPRTRQYTVREACLRGWGALSYWFWSYWWSSFGFCSGPENAFDRRMLSQTVTWCYFVFLLHLSRNPRSEARLVSLNPTCQNRRANCRPR